ncbi:unnamed protein product [Heterobilharzia americana]|nr:unnamed protein product [Heterobilharzia americana]
MKIISKLLEEIQPIGVYIFAIGLIVFIVCLLGLIGACCKSRWMVCIYLTLHIIILVPETIIIAVYYCKPDIVTTFGRDIFNTSIHNYVGYNSPDIHSAALNQIMIQLQCCGLMNGSDFDTVKSFKRNIIYKGEPNNFKYPVSCCKMNKSQDIIHNDCPEHFTLKNSNIHTGCWRKIETYLKVYADIIAHILCVVLGFQVLLVLFTLIVARTNRRIKPI